MNAGTARAMVQDVGDNAGADSLWFWALFLYFFAVALVWYFTGWPFGPRGR
ncbi:Hypothetical protein A7982_08769 [Minicystis rosea]|nr:Hypothetical protein A7982_08769 [Minicystis rosea]